MDDRRPVSGEGGPVECANSITLTERMQRLHDAEEHAGCPICKAHAEALARERALAVLSELLDSPNLTSALRQLLELVTWRGNHEH